MGKLFPIILAVIGIGGGVGAGLALRPETTSEQTKLSADPCGDIQNQKPDDAAQEAPDPATLEYVKLNNQFVVPVVQENRVDALVVISLSVEVEQGYKEEIYSREPKLRDAFLQVFFDHANAGGFRGAFTNSNNMDVLRKALRETAKDTVGSLVTDVLIMEIARQDV